MAKSAEAFRTISEAAAEIDVPQHVLRHWEDVFGQIRPMRRAGGRRYYRPVDLDLLRGVRVLLYDERYTTKGVQKIFKENGVKYISEIGRRAAAGEPVELRSGFTEEGDRDAAPAQAGAQSATQNIVMTPQLRSALRGLLLRLEKIEYALDEAALAIEAIDTEQE